MPDSKTEPTPPTQGSIPKRWGIGLNVAFQVLLVLALFFGVNRISYRYHTRWDLSPQQSYTLSSSTLNYVSKLPKDVFIANVFARDAKIFTDVQALLEEYRINGRGRIKLRSIDPLRDIERAEELKAETGLPLDQNGIVIKVGNLTRFIREEEMVIRDTGTETTRAIKAFRGEDAVTSALINLVEGGERKFYLVVGKGSRTETALTDAMTALGELGRQQNFQLLPVNLAEISRIPEDADGLLLVGIRYDLSEREIAMIKTFWEGKRAGLLVMMDPAGETPRLHAFLGLNGVIPREDRVLYAESTGSGTRKEFSVQGLFDNESPITQPLAASTVTLPGQSQSLDVRFDDEYLQNQSITVNPLIGASDRYWGEKNYLEDLPVVDEEDTRQPIYLAASVERGSVADPRLRVDSCRMVVVGNASMLDKKSALAVNRDFVASSLNWIINRDRLSGTPPKLKHSYRIQLNPRQNELIFWITTIAMPGLVLGLGMLVWASRRAA
ncbi:ABC transporter family protein [Prosthecobacter fusiformis]|uniref:ABC transporter family protein n=1 Tax=Prosthecobacter fusiformis TaxID=48464 RepID=A0A4V3FFH4_9BACT|nr:GldG family protein [Prosthecobacter fusiformis]TDU70773.1 ABC transporter family protein [Prosthecobacter fusiformis]